uniref:Putative PIWI-like protein 1 n=1 Tax=Trypanosoma congolense (strain IL3000) TaxID=1068625 RepID=G0UVK8_TRYCI|nr:putative PIWI-like protein 1 [Trypanosoma congolense IL3000]
MMRKTLSVIRTTEIAPHTLVLRQRLVFYSQAGARSNVSLRKAHVAPKGNLPAASTGAKSLWPFGAQEVSLPEVKRDYVNKRALDKKTRFTVRQRIRDEGVTSNLFPVMFNQNTSLFSYEVRATRHPLHLPPLKNAEETSESPTGSKERKGSKKKKASTSQGDPMPLIKRVECSRAWAAIQRYLRRCAGNVPPVVNVRYKVYSTAPLPVNALELPPEYLDLGWIECKLHFNGKIKFADMEAAELQETVNKIVMWSIRKEERQSSHTFCVAKESSGKAVHVHNAVTVDGLRVFKGTIVRAMYVNTDDAEVKLHSPLASSAVSPPPGDALKTLPAGSYEAKPLRFLVEEFVRSFVFKNRNVQSYKISDASGTIQASLWDATEETRLEVGCVYDVTGYRVRVFETHNGMRLVEMTMGKSTFDAVKQEQQAEPKKDGDNVPIANEVVGSAKLERRSRNSKKNTGKKEEERRWREVESHAQSVDNANGSGSAKPLLPKHPGSLVLKIDTKCTVASELSLWDEVKQHFGSGPYDAATMERITCSVQGTPVVTSTTLRHSIVRVVRFNMVSTEENIEPSLSHLLHKLEPGQPYALLRDYTIAPLQALHCCFDPRMKSWQTATVSTCSFMPSQRLTILELFRGKVGNEMRDWGLAVEENALSSKAVSLLPTPSKESPYGQQKWNEGRKANLSQQGAQGKYKEGHHPPPPSFPTTIAVVGILPPQAGEEDEGRRIKQTAQAIGRYFRTTTVITVADEQEAVRYLIQQLTTSGNVAVQDPNAAAVIVTDERETRLARWVQAECLTRGIMPVFIAPVSSPKLHQLRCANARTRLRTMFESNPLRGVDLYKEVPAIRQRRVLLVGVDSCHTPTVSTGSIVGILCTPERNHLFPFFWKHEQRGQEVELVNEHFGVLISRTVELYGGLDEVVVFQDGDVFSEMMAMRAHVPAGCGFTFACLHKRSDVRFVHLLQGEAVDSTPGKALAGNAVKGTVVQALTPLRADVDPLRGEVLNSFYLQNHDCDTSTARTVHYTLHNVSPTLDVSDMQQLSHVLAHVASPRATKLPIPTRCAHRLSAIAERLIDAAPPLEYSMIPAPLNGRLWFL